MIMTLIPSSRLLVILLPLSQAFQLSVPAAHYFGTGISKRTVIFSSNNDGDDTDANRWTSSNDPNYEEENIDWMERLNQKPSWEDNSFAPSEDDDGNNDNITASTTTTTTPEVDDGEAWLDILQSISAEEVSFMNKEAERADKQRVMQEMGYSKQAIESTLDVATDSSKEYDAETDEIIARFQEETAKSGFGMVVEDVDDDLTKVESHTRVEIDDETGEPARSQMVYVDEHSCIGCTNCAMIAQSTFFMDDEHGRARVFQQWGDDDETIQVAIETCPVDCIHYVPYDELKRLEVDRRGQNINFKARLVSQGEYGGAAAMSHRGGGANAFTAPQQISGNMGSRCNNCPSAGCKNCPMYGVGKNPEFEKKEKTRKEKMMKRELKQQLEQQNKSADL